MYESVMDSYHSETSRILWPATLSAAKTESWVIEFEKFGFVVSFNVHFKYDWGADKCRNKFSYCVHISLFPRPIVKIRGCTLHSKSD